MPSLGERRSADGCVLLRPEADASVEIAPGLDLELSAIGRQLAVGAACMDEPLRSPHRRPLVTGNDPVRIAQTAPTPDKVRDHEGYVNIGKECTHQQPVHRCSLLRGEYSNSVGRDIIMPAIG